MNQPPPQDLDEARLTAYALDELSGDERAQVERLLAAGTPQAAEALREIASIRALGTQLTSELARELGAGHAPLLTPAQRAAIRRAAHPARSRPILRWSLAAACAALAAGLMVAVLVPVGAPATQEVAVLTPGHASRDAAEKTVRSLAPAPAPAPAAAMAPLPSDAAKPAATLRAPLAERPAPRGGSDALAKRGGPAVANEQTRTHDGGADASAPVALAAPAPALPPAASAAPAVTHARAGMALQQRERALTDAAPAPGPAAAAPAAPSAPAVAATSPSAAAPVGGRPPPPAQPLAMKDRQQASGPGAPGAGAIFGNAGAEAKPAGAPAAEPTLIADRVQFVQDGAAADKGAATDRKKAMKSASTDAAAAGAAPSAASAAEAAFAAAAKQAASTGADGMMSTSLAARVQVPLQARTQSVDSLRRCFDAGRLPPPALVRVGDLINAVPVDPLPQTMGPATIAIVAGPCPWQPDHQLLAIGFGARRVVTSPRLPLNLVLLADDSAPMRGDDRLPLIKTGLASLVRGLGGADRLSLVAYGAQARLVIDGMRAEDAAAAQVRIDGLSAAADAGGADAAAGLELALQALHRNRFAGSSDEVVWCTAGVPDGDPALADQLRRMAADGVGLQLMAVGHDHPENGACERVTALGHGSFTYLATAAEAASALGAISGPHDVVARQALAEITFNPAAIASYRLVGTPPMSPWQPGDVAVGGELLAGQTVTLLFEFARPAQLTSAGLRAEVTAGVADPDLISVRLSYRLIDGQPGKPITARLGVAAADGQDPIQLKLIAAAAELGLALRHPDDPRYRWERMLVNAQADRSKGAWRNEGLIDLITRARALPAQGQGR